MKLVPDPDQPQQATIADMLASMAKSAGPAAVEPPSQMRTAAAGLRQMFVALIAAGFAPAEALALVGEMLRGSQS